MTRPDLESLQVKIFADGADRDGILALSRNPLIKGFTTNPTLMRAARVVDYERFAREILELVPDHPFSFEVLSDDFNEMERQAQKIATWGENVYVKIPVTNCKGEASSPVVQRLADDGIQLNVTAIMTLQQVEETAQALECSRPGFVSVFAGRIADTGCDPVPVMREAVDLLRECSHLELIWASPRQVLNLFEADHVGCHIITVTHDLLRKLSLIGKDLTEFSLDTVKMFVGDAHAAGYSL